MTVVHIDGTRIHTEADFHRLLARELDIGPYYGHNLAALWDSLSANVVRPVLLVWDHSDASHARLGNRFEAIIDVLTRVVAQDRAFQWSDRFEFELR